MGWPTLGLQDDGRRASAAISLTRPRSALRNKEYPGCRCMLVALSLVCGLLRSAKHLFLAAKAAGAGGGARSLVPCPHPVERSQRHHRRRSTGAEWTGAMPVLGVVRGVTGLVISRPALPIQKRAQASFNRR